MEILDLPLINCEIELDWSWSKECIISKIPAVPGNLDANPPVPEVPEIQTTSATFQINNAKLYVPVVILSASDNVKFLENIKQGFKRTTFWSRYRCEITTQTKKINLDYLFDPTFRNNSRFFVLSFKNGNNEPTRENYMPLGEIKDFNGLIDNKSFLINK